MLKRPKPKPLPRVLRVLGHHLLRLCWLTYALGLAWVLLHPAVTVSTGESKPRGTYISENALLVDSFEPRCSHAEAHAAREYQRAFAALPSGDKEQTLAWLEAQLRALDRVEAYRHTFATPLETRANVYGILRAAPLADGKESVVLVAHYRNVDSGEYSGVALGLALLQYLVDAKWLAKDVVLLFADDGPLDGSDGFAPGTEAWLQAYHMDPLQQQQQLRHEELPMRAGVIRAALNLETLGHTSDATVMGVFAAGINGQLPNLDLVNTAVLALNGEHIPVALDRCTGDDLCGRDVLSRAYVWLQEALEAYVPVEYKADAREYLRNLNGMLRFMKTLATGPAGAHAHFIRYNIDSITLSTLSHGGGGSTALSLRAMLRALEKVVRSLSNLEEKLHQSFFLYVLPNTRHFVSVGEYYYVVALAVSPAIAHMAVLASRTVGMRLAFSSIALLVVEAWAFAVLAAAPGVFSSAGEGGRASSGWGFLLAVTGAQAAFVTVVLPLLRSITVISGCAERREWRVLVRTYEEKHKGEDKKDDAAPPPVPLKPDEILASIPQQDSGWRGMKFIAMILLVYAHCILGIINYPMAFFCAAPMSLFALIEPRGVTKSVVKQAWCAFWLLVSSPIALFAVGFWLYRDGFLASLAYIADSFTLDINLLTLPYLCCLYLPVHTLSLGIWLYPTTQEALDELELQDPRAKKTN